MKTLFYLLTIGGLLWLFFNPNGILTYNAKNNEVFRLNKTKKKHEQKRDEKELEFNWLEDFIGSIDSNNKEKKKHLLEKHGSDIGLQLILRNFFKKPSEALKIIIKEKGLNK